MLVRVAERFVSDAAGRARRAETRGGRAAAGGTDGKVNLAGPGSAFARQTARLPRVSGDEVAPAASVFVVCRRPKRPQKKSPRHFRRGLKIFFSQCFQGSRENQG